MFQGSRTPALSCESRTGKPSSLGGFRGLLSIFLVLNLAFAGAVGISPLLHLWVEHGGHGPAHSHRVPTAAPRGSPSSSAHAHFDGPAAGRSAAAARIAGGGLVEHHRPFSIPGINPIRVGHAIGHLLGAGRETEFPPADPQGGPGHEHHSLAQLLAGGLVDHTPGFPEIPTTFARFRILSFPVEALLLETGWDLQSASRGPPWMPG